MPKPATGPTHNAVPKSDDGNGRPDSNLKCQRIVDDIAERLIDLNFNGLDSISEIKNKTDMYKKVFQDSGLNEEYSYKTQMLALPEGDDANLKGVEVDKKVEGEGVGEGEGKGEEEETAVDTVLSMMLEEVDQLEKEMYENSED